MHYFLDGKKYETADIGASLERVLRFYTVNGKLTGTVSDGVCVGIGVHPDLKAIGIQKIEIDFKNAQVAFMYEGTYLKLFHLHFVIFQTIF